MGQAFLLPTDNDPFTDVPGTGLRLTVTGHRPNKIIEHNGVVVPTVIPPPTTPERLEQAVMQRLYRYVKFVFSDMPVKPEIVYIGMALGFDQAVANACVELKIPFFACIPFKGQEHVWTGPQQGHYHFLLKRASQITFVCEGRYAPWKYIKRDQFMVDSGTHMLSFWNGMRQGGTYKTVKMAEKKGIPIANCWQPWARFVYKDETKVPHQVCMRLTVGSHDQAEQAGESSSPASREWRLFRQ